MKKRYRIAGLTVEMDCFGRTERQARPYLITDDIAAPDLILDPDWKGLQALQPHLSDDDSAYIASAGQFYRGLLAHGGMMLHASAVVVEGRAYLFSAPSGTGKSTHTRLWLERFGGDAYILNDDKPALRCLDGRWHACGTPWSGKDDISANETVPLAGICFLRQGSRNVITPLAGAEAIHAVLGQTVRPEDAAGRMILLTLLDSLLTQVPCWQMACNMDRSAAQVSWEAMSNHERKKT